MILMCLLTDFKVLDVVDDGKKVPHSTISAEIEKYFAEAHIEKYARPAAKLKLQV